MNSEIAVCYFIGRASSFPRGRFAMRCRIFLAQSMKVTSKLEREFAELQYMTREATGSARSLLLEAEDADTVLALLKEAAVPQPVNFSPIDDPEADLSLLDERRRAFQRQLRELREEIADVERLSREASEFEGEAREQEARLASIGLIPADGGEAATCPLCESHLAVPVPTVAEIRTSLTSLQTQLRSVRRDAPRLQERLASLESASQLDRAASRCSGRHCKAHSQQ
jgi:hypothetical protein